ncbi:hypothetical protein BDV98DRAFT_638939 [Pterulicium gracile]|uniref:Uncharacterized protein n=1 Tax=Pterulicium gracile TaxID=1884261 RepID=A0A5C3QBP9_9AGAR|nr:hypothetical protein BDV98DRAFT_638939 [Pterula gracilis]
MWTSSVEHGGTTQIGNYCAERIGTPHMEDTQQASHRQNPAPSKKDTQTRWPNIINSRLQQDCASTNTYLFGERPAKPELIMDTWRGTLADQELDDPKCKPWTYKSEVLVGMSLEEG